MKLLQNSEFTIPTYTPKQKVESKNRENMSMYKNSMKHLKTINYLAHAIKTSKCRPESRTSEPAQIFGPDFEQQPPLAWFRIHFGCLTQHTLQFNLMLTDIGEYPGSRLHMKWSSGRSEDFTTVARRIEAVTELIFVMITTAIVKMDWR